VWCTEEREVGEERDKEAIAEVKKKKKVGLVWERLSHTTPRFCFFGPFLSLYYLFWFFIGFPFIAFNNTKHGSFLHLPMSAFLPLSLKYKHISF